MFYKKFLLAFTLLFASVTPVLAVDNLPEGFATDTVAEGFERPTSAAFAPDGRIFVSEKGGIVRVIDASGALLDEPFITLQDVNSAEDRGLIGIAVDPDFSENGYIYLAYTYEVDPLRSGGYDIDQSLPGCENASWSVFDAACVVIAPKTARVVRVEAEGDVAKSGSEEVILGALGGTPEKPSCKDYPGENDCIASDSGSHSIGGIRFGQDGKLYVATGDGAGFFSTDEHAFRSQDINHLSGKILRINTDGTGVSDNPFYTGDASDNASKVWGYGFRNPFRFNVNPASGNLFVADVGWGAREEINIIKSDDAGNNHGWPCREGTTETGGYNFMSGCPIEGATQEPIYDYAHANVPGIGDNVGAVIGGAFATSELYPESFRDSYVFADAVFGFMKYITLDGDENVSEVKDFGDNAQFPVDFVTGTDGMVYYLTHYGGQLRKITYTENPQAVIDVSSAEGAVPFGISFSASGSSILGDLPLSYAWDFGNGDSAAGENVVYEYTVPGTYSVVLTATAENGRTGSTQMTIVADEPYGGGYDVDPYHIISTTTPAPHYFGTPIAFSSRIGNNSGSDAFDVVFQIHNEDGTHLEQYDVFYRDQVIAAGGEKTFSHNIALPVGRYSVNILIESPDKTQNYGWISDVVTLDILTRSPGTSETAVTVYRFWSDAFQGHFYTVNLEEKENLENNDPNWRYEGEIYDAFPTQIAGTTPVYRFWSEGFQGHFFTTNLQEKERLEQTDQNWVYEGVAYYVFADEAGDRTPVYRFWSDVYKHHFFTPSYQEFQSVMTNDPNWAYEGVAWYVQ